MKAPMSDLTKKLLSERKTARQLIRAARGGGVSDPIVVNGKKIRVKSGRQSPDTPGTHNGTSSSQ